MTTVDNFVVCPRIAGQLHQQIRAVPLPGTNTDMCLEIREESVPLAEIEPAAV